MKVLVISKPIYDYILPLEEFPMDGDKFYINNSINTLSNVGSLVAITFSRYGLDTSFTGVLGEDDIANKIKDIWNVESNEINIDEDDLEIAELQRMKSRKRQAATRCRDMAYAAEKLGNTEKYEMFMQQYESLMDEVSSYDEEISKAKLEKI